MKWLALILMLLVLETFSVFSQTNSPREFILDFPHKELKDVLQVYADLTQRTVLHADLPQYITFKVVATNRAEAIKLVTQALEKEHLTLLMDGEKFVILAPDFSVAHAKAVLAKNPSPVEKAGNQAPDPMPAGTINFPNCPLSTAFSVYQHVVGAAGLEPNPTFPLPPVQISLMTQTALTRKEAIHAFDIIFGLNGFKMVPAAGNQLKAVPF